VRGRPRLKAARARAIVEDAVCRLVARYRCPQIVWPLRILRLLGLLRFVATAA
jgi:hypothetical protein